MNKEYLIKYLDAYIFTYGSKLKPQQFNAIIKLLEELQKTMTIAYYQVTIYS